MKIELTERDLLDIQIYGNAFRDQDGKRIDPGLVKVIPGGAGFPEIIVRTDCPEDRIYCVGKAGSSRIDLEPSA